MLHESVAEFDPNAQGAVTPEMVNQVRDELKPVVSTYDPVDKLILKLTPLYEQLREMMNINLEPDNAEQAIADLDQISDLATKVADQMRTCLVKQGAMLALTNGECSQNMWSMEDFRANLKYFMMHRDQIKQQGYDKTVYTVGHLACLYGYDIRKMLNLHIMANENNLPDYPFNLDQIRDTLSKYGTYMDSFATTEDMFNCLFMDHERLLRLEEKRTNTIDLDELFESLSYEFQDRPAHLSNDSKVLNCELICYISRYLRQVKQGAYQLQCDIMDHQINVPSDEYHRRIRTLISGTADMFYVPTIKLFSSAYELRAYFMRKKAITDYVTQTMECMKSTN